MSGLIIISIMHSTKILDSDFIATAHCFRYGLSDLKVMTGIRFVIQIILQSYMQKARFIEIDLRYTIII